MTDLLRAVLDACTTNAIYPGDQSEDDHQSLCCTGAALEQDVHIVGQPVVLVHFAVDLCLPTVDLEAVSRASRELPPPGQFKSSLLQHSADVYRIGRTLSGRLASFDGERLSAVEVEPNSRLIKRHTFSMAVDADHPDQAYTTMEVTLHLERPVADVKVQVRTVVTLTEMTIEAEASLAGFNMLRRSWTKHWSAP